MTLSSRLKLELSLRNFLWKYDLPSSRPSAWVHIKSQDSTGNQTNRPDCNYGCSPISARERWDRRDQRDWRRLTFLVRVAPGLVPHTWGSKTRCTKMATTGWLRHTEGGRRCVLSNVVVVVVVGIRRHKIQRVHAHAPVESVRDALTRSYVATPSGAEPIPRERRRRRHARDMRPGVTGRADCQRERRRESRGERKKEKGCFTKRERRIREGVAGRGQIDFSPSTGVRARAIECSVSKREKDPRTGKSSEMC